jgi:hypothetical protein
MDWRSFAGKAVELFLRLWMASLFRSVFCGLNLKIFLPPFFCVLLLLGPASAFAEVPQTFTLDTPTVG